MVDNQFSVGARRTRVGALLAAAAIALVAVLFPGVAAAHGASGTMTVTKFEQSGPERVRLEVGLVYEGDEHLAEDATVTATLTSPTGENVGPIDLPRVSPDSSLYGADIEVATPGAWSAEITSVEPAATATATVEVVAESTTTTTAASDTTPTTAPVTTAPATTAPAAIDNDTTDTSSPAEDSSDDSSNTGLIIAIVAAAVIIVGGLGLVLTRGKSDQPDSGLGDPSADSGLVDADDTNADKFDPDL